MFDEKWPTIGNRLAVWGSGSARAPEPGFHEERTQLAGGEEVFYLSTSTLHWSPDGYYEHIDTKSNV
jgi:hypothetical protein